ncbi:type II secretion system F family protein [Candidatus Sumerlaeota bacterium]|nr:type II secretion system F family protein [Candidatus Sumerlaeota bacterium]
MPLFHYVARDPRGQVVNGRIEAANTSAVVRILRERQLMPTSIEETRPSVAEKRRVKGRWGRVRIFDLAVFCRQTATMLRAGLTLTETLDILSEQAEKATLKTVLKTVQKDVEAGSSLTEAISRHPKVFNQFFISMIKAGEASGMLDSILDQMAIYFETVASIQRKIRSAVVYPIVVFSFAIAVTIFLLTSVVPVFKEIYAGAGGTLPIPTQIIIAISDIIKNRWWMVLLVLVGIIIAAYRWNKTPSGRRFFDTVKIRMPIFGKLFLKASLAKFARTFATLMRSGVNVLTALEIVAKTSGNILIEEEILRARTSIRGGESISQPLAESPLFPPMVTRMISVGERTGALENMLNKVAEFYEDQVSTTVAALTSVIEPVLIIIVGLMVGFIVISMFLPMFKMWTLIEK